MTSPRPAAISARCGRPHGRWRRAAGSSASGTIAVQLIYGHVDRFNGVAKSVFVLTWPVYEVSPRSLALLLGEPGRHNLFALAGEARNVRVAGVRREHDKRLSQLLGRQLAALERRGEPGWPMRRTLRRPRWCP